MIQVTDLSSSTSEDEPIYIPVPTKQERVPAYWIVFTKLVSGRFILTVGATIAFLIIVMKLSNILVAKAEDLDSGQILLLLSNLALVIQNVFNSYFAKRRPTEENGKNGTTNTIEN